MTGVGPAAERTRRLETEYTFYPTVRRGYRPTSEFDGSADVEDAGALGVDLTVKGSGPDGERTETAGASLRMYGPGDVVGVDERQVVRVEPDDGADAFPPNQFPLVEFDRPDLPWLFSPQRADDRGRNRPWLSLVCVERDRGAVRIDPPGRGPLPVLRTPVEELPDPDESWAWAHAQVTGPHDPDEEFATRSNRTVSRLLCPRNLDDDTAYLACVVPTFDAGRRAGLGASPATDDADDDGDRLSLSWERGADGTVRLPVYCSWEFRTGQRGDFESLVRELEPVDFGPEVGYRTIDVGDPGPDVLAIPDEEEATVGLGGALRSADAAGDAYGEEHRATLRALLDEPAGVDEAAGAPVVGPPKYGQWHAGLSTIGTPPAPGGERDDDGDSYPTWFHTLNTDPRHRIAASLGAETVRKRQEELMASAWEQFGDVRELNGRLRRMQLARTAVSSTHAELVDDPGGGSVRPGTLLQFSAPAHDRMLVSTAGSSPTDGVAGSSAGTETLRAYLDRTPLPAAATSTAFRRVARSGGPLARRRVADFDGASVVEGLAEDRLPRPDLDGLDARVELDGEPADERASLSEEEMAQAEEEMAQAEEEMAQAEEEMAQAEEEMAQAEEEMAQAEAAEEAAGREESVDDSDAAGGTGVVSQAARDVRFLPDRPPTAATEASPPAWRTDREGNALTVEEAVAFQSDRDDGERGHLLVARTVRRLRSATEQCLTARSRVLALRLALRRAGADEPPSPEVAKHVADRPTLVDDCEAVRTDSLPELERLLSELAADPRPEAVSEDLTNARVEDLLDRFRAAHDALMTVATRAQSSLRSGEFDVEDVAASLSDADEHLSTLLAVIEAIEGHVETGPSPATAEGGRGPEPSTPDAGLRTAESDAGGVARDEPPTRAGERTLDLDAVQAGLPSELDPEVGLAWLAADVSGVRELVERDDPVEEVLAHPTFTEPMFRSLLELDPEYLLPGVGSVPKNAMGALVTNPRFVEAYMVGLNHEMARELAWRRFPTDRRGTYFRRFWERRGAPDSRSPDDLADVDPLHEWDQNDLGENGPGRSPVDRDTAAQKEFPDAGEGGFDEAEAAERDVGDLELDEAEAAERDVGDGELEEAEAAEFDDRSQTGFEQVDEPDSDDTGETGFEQVGEAERDDAGDDASGGRVVLLIRGEVFRRHPNTTVYAAKAVQDDGDRVPALPNTHVSRRTPSATEAGSEVARLVDDDLDGPTVPPDDDPTGPPDEPQPPDEPFPVPPESPEETEPQFPDETSPQPPTDTPPDQPDETEVPEPGGDPSAGEDVKHPLFRGTLEPDVTFLGFDLSVEQAVSGPFHSGGPKEGVEHDEQDEGWFFVLEEAPGETRFGLDENQGDVGTTPEGITYTRDGERQVQRGDGAGQLGEEAGWSALSWGHLVTDDAIDDGDGGGDANAADAISHVDVDGSRPGREQWSVEATDDEWTDADAAEWGRNAAHMARITWQQPVRVAIHADDVLPDADADSGDAVDAEFDADVDSEDEADAEFDADVDSGGDDR